MWGDIPSGQDIELIGKVGKSLRKSSPEFLLQWECTVDYVRGFFPQEGARAGVPVEFGEAYRDDRDGLHSRIKGCEIAESPVQGRPVVNARAKYDLSVNLNPYRGKAFSCSTMSGAFGFPSIFLRNSVSVECTET